MSSQDLILEARDLTRYYTVSQGPFKPAATVKALDGVSFEVEAGKTLAVVGESGCGKSTLARQLTMIERPTSGELKFDGFDLVNDSDYQLKLARQRVQMIFQNPYGSLNPRKKIGTIIGEPLVINRHLAKMEVEERVRSIMTKVGLRPEHYDRYPHMFSGGQRQRIAIARALMLEPKLVVADEPVSALDVSVQAQVLNLLKDLQQEMTLAFVFIAHDLSVVRYIADKIMVMYLGQIAEYGQSEQIFSRPRHPYTQALLASTPHLKVQNRKQRVILSGELPSPLSPPSGCVFHTRCPFATSQCAEQVPEIVEFDGRLTSCLRAAEIAAEQD
ncbi:dipeptide transport system ATP-binding protein [Desulfuromusa kysingii]|uniref:Dipeptide transport system ATP-binding protein n=1 Tax=Desulfuromusa kysingii TaxID=37625 RepID=A0A1H3VG09_9BACT|nr:dipeptide ABC transporter ATP-binding protein [Desulfuromusa kysingii]SDZ73601.1 dipeptide transport system ATP-binding protein [Desulfuromusa kysingii]